jgi:hypothetical protein
MTTATISSMSEATHERLVEELIYEIEDHPYKDEILSLATAQLLDDDA